MTDIEQGREAFGRRAWADAFACLTAADRESPLAVDDLERVAVAAYLIGLDEDGAELMGRAHQEAVRSGDLPRAARNAFWAGMSLLNRGEMARGGGWIARAARLVEECGQDCVEQGFLFVPAGLQLLGQGDAAGAHDAFGQALAIGDRYRDPDLMTLGRMGRGQSLVMMGRAPEGVALLDEAMIAVTANEVSPIVSGIVYCGVIDVCQQIFDLRRAHEWTAALTRWCETQPDLVPFRGQCLVHRAEIMQLHGAWQDALDEAQRARERLSDPPGQPAAGAAHYQEAELHRLRGEFAEAQDGYRRATQFGRQPEPGLALLRLAQGQVAAAAAAIRRALDEAGDPATRSRLLAAHVEIMLASGDVQPARASAAELAEIAATLDAPLLHAMSARTIGAVLLEEGDPRGALASLRRAWAGWQELEAPYEAARVRVLIALACRKLGDEDTAEMELDAARWVFRELGAAPELAKVEALSQKAMAQAAGGLSAREVEVLRLVAAGKTNREIANDLMISEKTVARHLSNIFTKLGLSSRAAATAYAYEHGLVERPA